MKRRVSLQKKSFLSKEARFKKEKFRDLKVFFKETWLKKKSSFKQKSFFIKEKSFFSKRNVMKKESSFRKRAERLQKRCVIQKQGFPERKRDWKRRVSRCLSGPQWDLPINQAVDIVEGNLELWWMDISEFPHPKCGAEEPLNLKDEKTSRDSEFPLRSKWWLGDYMMYFIQVTRWLGKRLMENEIQNLS